MPFEEPVSVPVVERSLSPSLRRVADRLGFLRSLNTLSLEPLKDRCTKGPGLPSSPHFGESAEIMKHLLWRSRLWRQPLNATTDVTAEEQGVKRFLCCCLNGLLNGSRRNLTFRLDCLRLFIGLPLQSKAQALDTISKILNILLFGRKFGAQFGNLSGVRLG